MQKIQQQVAEFARNHGLAHTPEITSLDLVSEMGEVAKEILKSTNYGEHDSVAQPEIAGELGDVFYCLIMLANCYSVDLQEQLNRVLEKYEKRLDRGDAGSQNE